MTLEVESPWVTSLYCLTWPHLWITPCILALFSGFTPLHNCLSFINSTLLQIKWFWSAKFSFLSISGKPIKWQDFTHWLSTLWWLKPVKHPGTTQVGKIFALRTDTSSTIVPLLYSSHTRTCRHLETCVFPNRLPIRFNTPQACPYPPFSSAALVSKWNLTHALEWQSTPLRDSTCSRDHHHSPGYEPINDPQQRSPSFQARFWDFLLISGYIFKQFLKDGFALHCCCLTTLHLHRLWQLWFPSPRTKCKRTMADF